MSTDDEYAGHVELKCISRLYPDTTFRVYRSNDLTEFDIYGSGARMCNLLFSGPVDAGHYSVLVFGNNINTQNTFNLPKEKNAKTKSGSPKKKKNVFIHNTHSLTGKRERKELNDNRLKQNQSIFKLRFKSTPTCIQLWSVIRGYVTSKIV